MKTNIAIDPEISDRSIYNYWKQIPKLKIISNEQMKVLKGNPIRRAIVNTLNQGINLSIEKKKPSTQTRHAMSATEILKKLMDLEIKVSRTNLYHHLDKLEDNGLISVIGTKKTGKRSTSYYCRNARVYLPQISRHRKNDFDIINQEYFKKLLLSLNSHLPDKEVVETIEQLKDINELDYSYFLKWIQENDHFLSRSDIQELDIEYIKLTDLVTFLKTFNKEVCRNLDKLGEMLNIDR